MAYPSVTYTFVNGTALDATQVNQDFTDVINGLTDGAHDLNMSAGTFAGVVTFNNNVVLGASSAFDLSFNASLATSVPIKTNTTYDFGSSTKGLASVYLGGTSTFTTRLKAATLASSWTLTLPVDGGTSRYRLETDGAGATSWVPKRRTPLAAENYSLTASLPGSSALTITLNDAGGSALSSTNPCDVVFRNATAATGTSTVGTLTASPSISIKNGSTLGLATVTNSYLYVYAINSTSTTIVLGVSATQFDDSLVKSATSEGLGTATSNSTLYVDNGTGSLTSKPIRLIGRMIVQHTAGAWSALPTEISLLPLQSQKVQAIYNTAAGQTFGVAAVINFGTKEVDTNNSVTVGSSWAFTAPKAGVYHLDFSIISTGGSFNLNESFICEVRVNTTVKRSFANYSHSATSHSMGVTGNCLLSLASGDAVDIKFTPGTVFNPVLTTTAAQNFICINEI